MSWVLTVASLLTTVAIAYVGFRIDGRMRKSDARQMVTSTLTDLTSGEVEEARHVVGTLRYGDLSEITWSRSEVTRAYFRLTWAIERAAASTGAVESRDRDAAHEGLTSQLKWHLQEIATNVELLSRAFKGDSGGDVNQDDAARHRQTVLQQLQSSGSRIIVDPSSTEFQRALYALQERMP